MFDRTPRTSLSVCILWLIRLQLPTSTSTQPVPTGTSTQPVPTGTSTQPVPTGASTQPVSIKTKDCEFSQKEDCHFLVLL
jgi:hypothetical protein